MHLTKTATTMIRIRPRWPSAWRPWSVRSALAGESAGDVTRDSKDHPGVLLLVAEDRIVFREVMTVVDTKAFSVTRRTLGPGQRVESRRSSFDSTRTRRSAARLSFRSRESARPPSLPKRRFPAAARRTAEDVGRAR